MPEICCPALGHSKPKGIGWICPVPRDGLCIRLPRILEASITMLLPSHRVHARLPKGSQHVSSPPGVCTSGRGQSLVSAQVTGLPRYVTVQGLLTLVTTTLQLARDMASARIRPATSNGSSFSRPYTCSSTLLGVGEGRDVPSRAH
jgi:hypothetical protein